MEIPTEIVSAIIGGIIGSSLPAFLTYVETVRAGYQQRLMLADEIEENHRVLFSYGQLRAELGQRILFYRTLDSSAWESAKTNKFLFLSQYELAYINNFYQHVRYIAYLFEHLEIYKLDDENTRSKASHVISLISDDCTTRYVAPKNDFSHGLVSSLRRKIHLLNYYPVIWGWKKLKIR